MLLVSLLCYTYFPLLVLQLCGHHLLFMVIDIHLVLFLMALLHVDVSFVMKLVLNQLLHHVD